MSYESVNIIVFMAGVSRLVLSAAFRRRSVTTKVAKQDILIPEGDMLSQLITEM